jgi:hypothetical protein
MMGPTLKPRTNKEVPRIMTSGETWKSLAVAIVAVLKTDEANVMTKVVLPRASVMVHLRALEKFMGFSGSPGPSHSMILGSLVAGGLGDRRRDSCFSMSRSVLLLDWACGWMSWLCVRDTSSISFSLSFSSSAASVANDTSDLESRYSFGRGSCSRWGEGCCEL